MASHKSAEKRARQNVRRAARNTGVRSRVKTAVKAFRAAIGGTDGARRDTTFEVATRLIRKACSQGVLHKRTASRRVSRLAKAAYKAAQAK